jgi:hypothetical protein
LCPSSPAPCNRWPGCILHPFEVIHCFSFSNHIAFNTNSSQKKSF